MTELKNAVLVILKLNGPQRFGSLYSRLSPTYTSDQLRLAIKDLQDCSKVQLYGAVEPWIDLVI